MLQRIQSVYLLIAAISLSLMALTPLITLKASEGDKAEQLVFTIYAMEYEQTSPVVAKGGHENKALAYLTYGVAVLLLINIFQFKNRPLQIRLARMGFMLSGALLLSIVVTSYRAAQTLKLPNLDWTPGWTMFMPVIALVCCVLAYFRIKADEALVKSVDRIR